MAIVPFIRRATVKIHRIIAFSRAIYRSTRHSNLFAFTRIYLLSIYRDLRYTFRDCSGSLGSWAICDPYILDFSINTSFRTLEFAPSFRVSNNSSLFRNFFDPLLFFSFFTKARYRTIFARTIRNHFPQKNFSKTRYIYIYGEDNFEWASRRNEDGSEIRTMIYDPLIKIVINSRMKSGGRLYALVLDGLYRSIR